MPNFSRPRQSSSTRSLAYSDYSLQDRDRPVYVDYISIELDDRSIPSSPATTKHSRKIATPPPAYVPGDVGRQRTGSRLSTFDFRSHALREKAGHLDLLRLLRVYGLRDLEREDWRRLNELRDREEREAYLQLLREGWDFSGYYGVLFSSLEAVAKISGPERGDHFLKKTEDGWREGRGLSRRTEGARMQKRMMAVEGSFVRMRGEMGDVKTAEELTEDLFGRFSLNLDEVLVREEERRTVKEKDRGKRSWTQGRWFRVLLILVFAAFLASIAGMFVRAGLMCLDANCAGMRMMEGPGEGRGPKGGEANPNVHVFERA